MIDSYSFGSITVNGVSYKDVKIHKGKASPWRCIEHHTVTKQDILEITEGTEFLVIGTGASGLVRVKDEVKEFAEEKGIRLVIQPTPDACDSYNELEKKGEKAAAILHSTC